ncbi:MAG: protein-disulfide reductase DsbD family protein [Candidatus Sumerlaeota bacterium]|nr:protein-disulfide reductase DsbD family protein [Candidatus Sumerlaeota bacterium]
MSRCLPHRAVVAIVLAGASSALAFPAGAADENAAIRWSARFDPAQAAPGAETRLRVEAVIEPGWHTYAPTQGPGGPKPTSFKIDDNPLLQPQGDFQGPAPHREFDSAFQMDVESLSGTVAFERAYRVNPTAAPGTVHVSGIAEAMLCNSNTCLPPKDSPLSAELTILPGAVGASALKPTSSPVALSAAAVAPASAPMKGPLSNIAPRAARSSGLGAFILAALAAGFGALLTPCVFPMAPITVSFFTKRSGRTSWRAVWQALLYSLSIIGSFLVLGLLLSIVFGATGANRFAANPWVNLFIAALFLVFAFSLFGAFEIRVPVDWLSKAGLAGRSGQGPLGILIMGFVFTVTSFTCTVGFVGFVLVMASQGDWLWPAIGMLFFAAAFSLPFFFLALFPQFLSRLPRSGGWLASVKVVMGLLEFAFAFKFLSNVDLYWSWGIFTRPLLLAVWTATAGAVGLYLLGVFRLAHEESAPALGPARLTIALGFLAFSLYLSRGLFGLPINSTIESYLPPPPYAVASLSLDTASGPSASKTAKSVMDTLDWFEDYTSALEAARKENKPLFLDFTGIYCTNCRLMETGVFPKPEIEPLLRRVGKFRRFLEAGLGE